MTWKFPEQRVELLFLPEWEQVLSFFFLKCSHLLNSIPPLQDNGQFSGDPGCWFCLKSERAGNLLT